MKPLLVLLTGFSLVLLAGCASNVEASIGASGSLSVFIKTEIPVSLESKIRPFSNTKDGPLINASDIFTVTLPPGIKLLASKNPSTRSYEGEFRIEQLDNFLALNPELIATGAISYKVTAQWEELTLLFSRETAQLFVDMFPFLNKNLIEALSPPALYEGSATPEEYKKMLTSLFGKKAMQDIEAAVLRLNIKTPAPILEYAGCNKTGIALAVFEIPLMTCIILEQPVTLRLRWQH